MEPLTQSQILAKEDELAKEMKMYDFQHKVDKGSNYYRSEPKKDRDLASYIFDNYKNLDIIDERELATIVTKCLTPTQMKRILLEYELKNFREDMDEVKEMTREEFIKKAKFLLNRYQCKAGGYYVEDCEWTMYTSETMPEETQGEHYVKDNEILFVNSIDKCDLENEEVDNYLNLLVDRLDSLADNIDVELRYSESEGTKPCWLHLWVIFL